MIKHFLAFLILFLAVQAKSQFTVKIVVEQWPDAHVDDSVYLTGAFNMWSPKDKGYLMKKEANTLTFTLQNVAAGLLEYKFTRGNWKTLESTSDGRLVAPRRAIIKSDTSLNCTIENWRDDFPASTASPQVHIWNDSLHIKNFDMYRRVWVYLPKDYANSNKRYPVIYMHDGQDLFDEATSQGRIGPLEWGVDETLDSSKNGAIVVAVAHAGTKDRRIQEYYWNANADYAEVYGKEYLDFVVNQLKPEIDRQFRTKPDKDHTIMAGSSMGGLITYYAGLMYPNVFGVLGVFSPSIWLDYDNIYKEFNRLENRNHIKSQTYFLYGGENENRLKPDGSYVKMNYDVLKSSEFLKKLGPTIKISINPEGRHGAWYWRSAFAEFYQFISKNF